MNGLTARQNIIAWTALLLLLAILAARLSMTEALRQTLTDKEAALAALAAPSTDSPSAPVPEVGPTVTTGFGVLTLLAAGLATWAGRGAISRGRWVRLLIIAGIVGLGVISTLHAQNRFASLVGVCDFGMALAGGWTISLLCSTQVLGDRGRRFVIAALIAILAAWCAKGFFQRYMDIPDTIQFYQENKEKMWQDRHLKPGDPGIILLEGRLMSREVTGFISYSNVLAAGLIGLISVAMGLLVGGFMARISESVGDMTLTPTTSGGGAKRRGAGVRGPPEDDRKDIDIPFGQIAEIVLGLLIVASVVVLMLTLSKGGFAAGLVCLTVIAAGIVWRDFVALHRRKILVGVLLVAVAVAGTVVTYGLRHHGLPSKSLFFRWQYWTAAMPIVGLDPLRGVGLNNFGDYYLQYKLPSAPEDVKDPHSIFIRLAAELGIPATVLFGVLLVWTAWRATRRGELPKVEGGMQNARADLFTYLSGGVFIVVWWILHYAISSPKLDWFVIMTVLYALVSGVAFLLAWVYLRGLSAGGLRPVLVAALIGALGMLVYDQINMALVTGSVAMLFWVLLGLADSEDHGSKAVGARAVLGMTTGAAFLASSLALTFCVWIPLANGQFSWDPAPYEWAFAREVRVGNYRAALTSIEAALERDPRSVELLNAKIRVEQALGKPLAGDIRHMLQLDRANARPRMDYGLAESDLSPAERVAILREAQTFDAALAAGEPKKLTAEDQGKIESTIAELGKIENEK